LAEATVEWWALALALELAWWLALGKEPSTALD